MKYLFLLSVLAICCIGAQTSFIRSIIALARNLIANPRNIINTLVNKSQLPSLITDIFGNINSGLLPLWLVKNTANHISLVTQKTPDFGSTLPIPNSGWYDFIVIGAGTAGSVIASRLTENPSIRVLLLEAGGPENMLSDIPLFDPYLARSPMDWGFLTVPQNNCFLNIENQQSPWPRGKAMGGSSAINAMFYIRGVPRDYDNWAAITGDNSWNYSNVLPFFLKSEHNTDQQYCADKANHNCNGLYTVTSNWASNQNPVPRKVLEAAAEFGINQIDLNAPQQTYYGCNGAQQAIVNGNRISVSKAFLESVKPNRPNLDIIALAFVKKIIFENKKAIGVEYDRSGVTYKVYASKEVILSAGVIKSPHLLLTSGVGPAHQLQNFNIPIIADLPGVGENLQDHVNSIGIGYTAPSIGLWPLSINSIISYLLLRKGPLAFLDGVQMLISSSINTDPDWPDIQLNAITFPVGLEPTGMLVRNVFGLRLKAFNQMYFPHALQPSFLLWGVNSRPRSRGNLYLQSSDPYVYPLIQPNYLSHPEDVKILIEATLWLYRFQYTDTFKAWNAKPFPELTVGCESVYSLVSDSLYPDMLVPNDAYIECYVRHMTISTWHYVGTCKMGNTSDATAVVDTQLRVKGVKNLRVIDSSIMPVITDGNTNAPTMMIAEKGAQMIKNYYNI